MASKRRSAPDRNKLSRKVRIIHIFSPEIIHTDADNFRSLVQRLTGKQQPPDQGSAPRRQKKPPPPPPPPPPLASSAACRETPAALKQEQLDSELHLLGDQEDMILSGFGEGDDDDAKGMALIFHDHFYDPPFFPASSSSSSSSSSKF